MHSYVDLVGGNVENTNRLRSVFFKLLFIILSLRTSSLCVSQSFRFSAFFCPFLHPFLFYCFVSCSLLSCGLFEHELGFHFDLFIMFLSVFLYIVLLMVVLGVKSSLSYYSLFTPTLYVSI